MTYRLQAPVVQKVDSAIHRINHYPADKYLGNQLQWRYPLDRDLSGGQRYPPFEQLEPGAQVNIVVNVPAVLYSPLYSNTWFRFSNF